MKEIVKKYYALDVEDVEKLVSDKAGREVKVGEMDVRLYDIAPRDQSLAGDYSGHMMMCEIFVDGEPIDEPDGPLWDYLIGVGEACVREDYIFAFDTALFGNYTREFDLLEFDINKLQREEILEEFDKSGRTYNEVIEYFRSGPRRNGKRKYSPRKPKTID